MWHDDHKVKKHKNAQIGTGAIRGLVLSPFQSRAFYGPRPTDFSPSVPWPEGRFSLTRSVITGLSHALSRLRFGVRTVSEEEGEMAKRAREINTIIM